MCILEFKRWLKVRVWRSAGVAKVSRIKGRDTQDLDVSVDSTTWAEHVETKVQCHTSDS